MEPLDFLLDPLRSGIDRRALLELALVGGFCGALGLLGGDRTPRLRGRVALARSAAGTRDRGARGCVATTRCGGRCTRGGGAIALAARDERIGPDTGTAVAVTGLVGLGALLALEPEVPQRLDELLFGDPLGVTDGDLLAAAALLVAGGAALVALRRPLCAVAFDPAGAAAAGVRPAVVRIVLLALLAAAIAVAARGLGALLVLAVLVAPPVAVGRTARTPAAAMLAGSAVAVLAGVVGIEVSFHAGTAAGASVSLALCLAAALGAALPIRIRAAADGARRASPGHRGTA